LLASQAAISLDNASLYGELMMSEERWRNLFESVGPQLTKLDIDDVIREVLALADGELRRHYVVLHTELAADDRPVMGDRLQLQQVLLNLIMNGVEAMRGVTERSRELTVSTTLTEPGSVLVAVEDTGPGLDPAVAQHMFEPFFTTKSDGLGMGLASAGQSSKATAGACGCRRARRMAPTSVLPSPSGSSSSAAARAARSETELARLGSTVYSVNQNSMVT
jgi:nitrogen-specific signal transduction histidine kinase